MTGSVKKIRCLAFLFIQMLLLPIAAFSTSDQEIEYLLDTVGRSGCTYIRNGKLYDSAKAESHLRMKYEKGRRHAPTAEAFIERLASQSSLSKQSYYIECPGEAKVTSGHWLTKQLARYRGRED
ncbi:MAG: DUF5329 domain-containing protein [Gammaproteobacteria bacterium]|nr:DUF5329 domain-containing protein [Gammaproteobacteria bacterium]